MYSLISETEFILNWRLHVRLEITVLIFLCITDSSPDDGPENPYHKIAVTILACFCTIEDMVSKFLKWQFEITLLLCLVGPSSNHCQDTLLQ